MKYNVHLFEVIRVMYENIEAGSAREAVQAAQCIDDITLPGLINRYERPEIEALLECTGCIVDLIDDDGQIDYSRSTFFNEHMEDIDAASKEEAGEEE